MVGRDVVALLVQKGDTMCPFTIVDDGDEINIRAVITDRKELLELAEKLHQRATGKEHDLTTYLSEGHQVDAQDVNRKELSNER
jgi:hypothetical protein